MAAPAKFSLSLGAKKKPVAPTRTKRPHSTLQESDDEDAGAGQPQLVSHFDQAAGGAIDANSAKQEKGPLVIKPAGNKDWREEVRRKRQRSDLPAGAQAQAQAQAQANGTASSTEQDSVDGAPKTYGLNIVERTLQQDTPVATGGETTASTTEPTAAPARRTEDEVAIAALMGEKPTSTLTIPAGLSEEEAFQRDFREAPDMATLEQYAAVPVEEFGAALLRGMGWKDGEAIGKRRGQKAPPPRNVTRRPALLGIGAKEEAAVGIELGSWGKAAKGKRKVDQTYNPVMLRNKETGEMVTEEELKLKMEQSKLVEPDRKKERSRRSPERDSDYRSERSSKRRTYSDDEDEKYDRRDRDRRRDTDRNYESKHRSSRRDRSSSTDDRRRKRRYDDYDDDRKSKDRPRRDRSPYNDDRRRRRNDDRSDDERRDRDRKRRGKDERDDRGSSRREHRDREYEDSKSRRRQEVY